MDRIFEELNETKVLISMLSPVSVSKPWINFEAGAAWMNKKVVIPVCIGGMMTLPLECVLLSGLVLRDIHPSP